VLAVGLYTWGWQIYAFVMKPVFSQMHGAKPTLFGPWAPFAMRFQVAFYASIIVGAPILIWQIGAFFLPALKEKERRYIVPTFLAAIILFAGGVAFCYYVILGLGFQWILAQGGSVVSIVPDAQKFLEGVLLLLIGFGVGFELPIVVFYLVIFNIVPYAKLRANWRFVYVGLMTIASLATPDWSPWTIGGLFIALAVLYEFSMLLARVTLRKRIAAQKAADLAIYGDGAES